ncbi:MAG: hypothetical protein J5589_05535 [Firmicutes bacterium]|nr:hypothetical protein [Bacillota bacterium]
MKKALSLILALVLILPLTGCKELKESLTVQEYVDQLELKSFLGRNQETICRMFDLSAEDLVYDPSIGAYILPYQKHYPWKGSDYDLWTVELYAEWGKSPQERVTGLRLIQSIPDSVENFREFMEDYIQQHPNTEHLKYDLHFLTGEELTDLSSPFLTNETKYLCYIDVFPENPETFTPTVLNYPKLIKPWQAGIRDFFSDFSYILSWGYVLFFLLLGAFVILRTRIFSRTKTARVRLIQLDDGQDINTRNFLSIPQGAIYQTRRMSRPATPMNEEFLNTRKLLFALIDENDRLLTLRARDIRQDQLKTGTIYRVTYKGNQLKKIEQLPAEEQ